jgi:hypothetical protein
MYVPIVPSTANATNNKSTNNDENTFFLEKSHNHSCFFQWALSFGFAKIGTARTHLSL